MLRKLEERCKLAHSNFYHKLIIFILTPTLITQITGYVICIVIDYKHHEKMIYYPWQYISLQESYIKL